VFEPVEPVLTDAIREGEEVLIRIPTTVTMATGDPVFETVGGWSGLWMPTSSSGASMPTT
jgi:hypothetical protein